jgi:hypothetical protein
MTGAFRESISVRPWPTSPKSFLVNRLTIESLLCGLSRCPGQLIGRHCDISRQNEGHSFGDHLSGESVSVTPSSMVEDSIVLCKIIVNYSQLESSQSIYWRCLAPFSFFSLSSLTASELIERPHVSSLYSFGEDQIEITISSSSSINVCLFITAETCLTTLYMAKDVLLLLRA